MIFLADESLDRQILDVLRRDDHVVLYVAEMDPGLSDDEVLNKANFKGTSLEKANSFLYLFKVSYYSIPQRFRRFSGTGCA